MEFTFIFFQDFLNELRVFDQNCKELSPKLKEEYSKIDSKLEKEQEKILKEYLESVNISIKEKNESFKKYESKLNALNQADIQRQNNLYAEINKYKRDNQEEHIERLRSEIFANADLIKRERDLIWNEYEKISAKILHDRNTKQEDDIINLKLKWSELSENIKIDKIVMQTEHLRKFDDKVVKFKKKFNPFEIEKKYAEIYAADPLAENFNCIADKDNPASVRIATLTYDLQNLGNHSVSLLENYYPALYRRGKLHIPFSIMFDKGFNYLFETQTKNREMFANRACSLAMRFLMMIPPNKVNFTFIDPITLGKTFALFGTFLDDNNTKKVINGQIWTSVDDINKRLLHLIDRISYVNQRCLQNKYTNIYSYNAKAGQNAESYEILMIMDFPSNFKEDSLGMLEKIMDSGPECGVYTIIFKNDEQVDKIVKIDKKHEPLLTNIEKQAFRFVEKNGKIICDHADAIFNGINFSLFINPLLQDNALPKEDIPLFSSKEELNLVLQKLMTGIKEAEKKKITFDESIRKEISDEKAVENNPPNEIVIPIGTYGADKTQNLSFGERYGCYHALIAGQTGSGKSSLLHTIIMSALLKYNANQLQIYLVDFKSGVEFKIFTNYKIDSFKAIAIESEREFGVSILEYLRRQMDERAKLFKRKGVEVDKLDDYHKKNKEELEKLGIDTIMPRILLIMDEFYFLFSKENDELRQKASKDIELIIKQGRAYGIHVILATQSLAGVGGISQDVWRQVGVRIALKCPKDDARLILGAGNDAVDQLPHDNPGEAIYNYESGNINANTRFRVSYIDQKEGQTKLLDEISERSQMENTSKLISSDKKTETRILISNVEDNIYSPFQKFVSGRDVEFNNNAVLVGESLQLFGNLRMIFKNKASSNMLIIGNDEQKARAMFTFCSLSLSLHLLTKNNCIKPSQPSIYIVDYAPLEDTFEKDCIKELADLIPSYVKYVTFDDSEIVLKELYHDLTERKKINISKESKYFLLFGLQRARDLRSNDLYQNKKHESFGIDDGLGLDIQQKLSVTLYDMFLNIIHFGATYGIHSIIWTDNFKIFMAHYSGLLSNFDLRVGFTMADDDSVLFIEEPHGSQISENNAVFSYNGNQKFRPYKMPDFEWLKKICNRINSF